MILATYFAGCLIIVGSVFALAAAIGIEYASAPKN